MIWYHCHCLFVFHSLHFSLFLHFIVFSFSFYIWFELIASIPRDWRWWSYRILFFATRTRANGSSHTSLAHMPNATWSASCNWTKKKTSTIINNNNNNDGESKQTINQVMDDRWESGIMEYSAINITGFRIVDSERRFVKDFLDGWKRLDSLSSLGAGRDSISVWSSLRMS